MLLLRKRPPTEQMAEPGAQATRAHAHRARQAGGGGVRGRDSKDVPVKLHLTVTGKLSQGFSFFSFLLPSPLMN